MRRVSGLLPTDVHTYRGAPWVTRFYLFLCLVITFRSLVHVFLKDGGANSIAGIDLDGPSDIVDGDPIRHPRLPASFSVRGRRRYARARRNQAGRRAASGLEAAGEALPSGAPVC